MEWQSVRRASRTATGCKHTCVTTATTGYRASLGRPLRRTAAQKKSSATESHQSDAPRPPHHSTPARRRDKLDGGSVPQLSTARPRSTATRSRRGGTATTTTTIRARDVLDDSTVPQQSAAPATPHRGTQAIRRRRITKCLQPSASPRPRTQSRGYVAAPRRCLRRSRARSGLGADDVVARLCCAHVLYTRWCRGASRAQFS